MMLTVLISFLLQETGVISGSSNNSWGGVVGLALMVSLLGFNFLSLHVSNPSLVVQGERFRLQTALYKSPWFTWDKIFVIQKPWKPFPTAKQIYAIAVEGLNPLFLLAGFNAQLNERAFIITSDIEDFDLLLSILKEKRPDMFPGTYK
ncbi:MAG: hypothetical protein OT477_23490 [Chloroflexi bacterium]|nr:hypothetical protein [Chloroflexota bacterium]